MSLSIPRGPSVERTVSVTAWQALMLEMSWPRPCDESVPSRSRMICGCIIFKGEAREDGERGTSGEERGRAGKSGEEGEGMRAKREERREKSEEEERRRERRRREGEGMRAGRVARSRMF